MSPTKLTRRILLAAATGLVATTLIAIPGHSADEHAAATPSASPVAADAPRVIVHIDRFTFKPREIVIKVGTRVVWSNDDGAAHTATADDDTFDSGQLTFSEKFGHTFEAVGAHTYYCAFHANMTGKVTVTN